jgi:hypothetical protein
MSQVNVNYPEGGEPVDRGTGVGTILAVLLALAVIALLVWGLALGGFGGGYAPAATGPAPGTTGATSAPATGGSSTINVNPSVNVQPPASTGGTSGSGSTTGTTGSGTTGGSTTAPAKP